MNCKAFAKKCDFGGDTKIVRVLSQPSGPLGDCWNNAVEFQQQNYGSKIVAGYYITTGKGSLYKNIDNIICKHYWNRHRGQYIDTTSMIEMNDNPVYVVDKNAPIGNWIGCEGGQSMWYYENGVICKAPTKEQQIADYKKALEMYHKNPKVFLEETA